MDENLVNLEEVGWGFHGSVYKCEHKTLKSFYARKYMHQSIYRGKEGTVYRKNQLNLCESIVTLVEELSDGSCLFELMSDGNLRHWKSSFTGEEQIWRVARSLIDACAFIEQRNLLHGDIKPENVLLDMKRNQIKLADFVESRDLKSLPQSPAAGSLPYMAPERLANRKATTKSDIWSTGVILLELCLERYPFSPCSNDRDSLSYSKQDPAIDWSCSSISFIELWESIHDTQIKIPKKYSRRLAELIKCCLVLDPERRLSASQLKALFKL